MGLRSRRTSEERTLWDSGPCPFFGGCPLSAHAQRVIVANAFVSVISMLKQYEHFIKKFAMDHSLMQHSGKAVAW